MRNILKSASKLVFLIMALAACIGFFTGRLPQESFMLLCSGAFTFYFSNKGESPKSTTGKASFGGK